MHLKKRERTRRRFIDLKGLRVWLHAMDTKCAMVVLAGMLVMMVVLCAASAPKRYNVTVGAISHQTITANKDVVDEITTEERRKAAANAVEPTYYFVEGASEQVLANLEVAFNELRTAQQYGLSLRADDPPEVNASTRTFKLDEIMYARTLVKSIPVTDYQLNTLLRADTEAFEVMVSSTMTAARNALNTTIREGLVNESIQTIQQIVGYRVDTALFQNVLPVVLRTCIQPNMVIEQESTYQARQAARDKVEPVVYLQGQNIIREGERVSKYQVEMLRSLGMLETNQHDLSVYVGTVIMAAAATGLLILLLQFMDKTVLHDLRKLSVVMVVMCLCVTLCVVLMKALHVYATPVAMGAMLLTGLLGANVALAGTLSLTALLACMAMGNSSALSTEMLHLLLMSLLGGVASLYFLKGKPQRVRVLLCGLFVALLNAILLLTMSFMTTSSLTSAVGNLVWCLCGGLISSILAVGLQPMIETIFNLATASKLMELCNPNQPLMRRLLLEAPGTYHHSIIVANLAEAAAEKIGANPLLARTGAYFHDIGKLKRPLYFKENQMGENPHDHTDPYVSAAIVTTHTRDGLILAQKHRLPPEIQRIIVEHHGDTPVMFFYQKASQLSEGVVDIADFRYDGSHPCTKESAIVMLADTIEAAVRSMPDPTPQAIERFIEKLVRGKLEDGQLSASPLTLSDIDGICEAFATVLNGVFHERIEYPSVEVPKRNIFTGGLNKAKEKAGKNKKQTSAPAEEEAAPQAEATEASEPVQADASEEQQQAPANDADASVSSEQPVEVPAVTDQQEADADENKPESVQEPANEGTEESV